jgi:hypothetical protein
MNIKSNGPAPWWNIAKLSLINVDRDNSQTVRVLPIGAWP